MSILKNQIFNLDTVTKISICDRYVNRQYKFIPGIKFICILRKAGWVDAILYPALTKKIRTDSEIEALTNCQVIGGVLYYKPSVTLHFVDGHFTTLYFDTLEDAQNFADVKLQTIPNNITFK